MRNKIAALLTSLLLILGAGSLFYVNPVKAQQGASYSQLARVAGEFDAKNYNSWVGQVYSGNSAAGVGTLLIYQGGGETIQDGTLFYPYNVNAPIWVDYGQANAEIVTPTTVAGCQAYSQTEPPPCAITATFVNTHGRGAIIKSGTLGRQEAINAAFAFGGGLVIVDRINAAQWASVTGGPTSEQAVMTGLVPYWNVSIVDKRGSAVVYWNPQGGATTLAAPTTLVAGTAGFSVNGANLTGGFYTGNNTYITCIAYVDISGQEGPCSASFTVATSGVATTDQIGYTAPAASPGAVGYTIYITLNGGAYNLSYKVPLVVQPTVVGLYPAAGTVCTLTAIETITPACAVTNTTYGQTGSGAVVSALTLNTSPINPEVTTISTTSVYVPNAGGRTTYAYAPGAHIGSGGTVANLPAFTIGAAAATTVPDVVGTINLAPGFMNVVGKTLEICGEMTSTATAATIEDVQFQWDAIGQNTAGKGVLIGDLSETTTFATTGHITFCQQFQTTVASASATGGSINHVGGYMTGGGVSLAAAGAGGDTVTPGAIGSLNLAGEARINIIYLHTTATDGAGWILQNVSAKLI